MIKQESPREGIPIKEEFQSPNNSVCVGSSTDFAGIHPLEEAEYDAIWRFMVEEAHDAVSGEYLKNCFSPFGTEFWEMYRRKSGSSTSVECLRNTFSDNLSQKIWNTDFDEATKIQLHFSYNIPIDRTFLDDLRLHADVIVREDGSIILYKERDGDGLHLSKDGTMDASEPVQLAEQQEFSLGESDAEDSGIVAPENSARRNRYTDEDELSMWNFLLKKIRHPDTGVIQRKKILPKGLSIWKEYRKTNQTDRAEDSLSCRFRRSMAPRLHLAKLDTEAKLHLYYALAIPVNKGYLQQLRRTANVRVDSEGCIVQYRRGCKREVDSPEEQKFVDLSRLKMERKRSFEEEEPETSMPAYKKTTDRDDISPSSVVVDDHFEKLLRETVGPSSSAQFTPLKRVQIGEDVHVTEAVNMLLSNQRETAERAVSGAEEYQGDEEVIENHMGDDGPMTAQKQLADSSTRNRERSSVEEEPVHDQPSSSGVPLKYLLDSLKEVIVEQNNELINAIRKRAPAREIPREEVSREEPPHPEKNSRSTKEFLTHLKTMILSLNSPFFDGALEKVNALIAKTENENNDIQLERIQVILEATLAMVPI